MPIYNIVMLGLFGSVVGAWSLRHMRKVESERRRLFVKRLAISLGMKESEF